MSKADFRAMREQAGYSQQALADALNVNVRTVKRWEHENDASEAPKDAWELLGNAIKTQLKAANYALQVALKQAEAHPAATKKATLTYYRDQAMYDRYGRDKGYFGVANANSRAAASELMREGFMVEFRYPCEDVDSSISAARSATESDSA
jgi:transcriptional regulator with XRE-family HTH domain